MRHKFSQIFAAALLTSATLTTANATVLLDEKFEYPVGDLYQQGGWLRSAHQANPIQVTSRQLSLPGFGTGNAVKLTSQEATDQDLQKGFIAPESDGTITGITEGPVYAAFLMNVQSVTDETYFFTFGTTNSSNILKDGTITTYGYVYATPVDDSHYTISISKGSAASSEKDASAKTLEYNTTCLVVVKYTCIEDVKNDTFEAWINPVPGSSEPEAELTAPLGVFGDPVRGLASISLQQATTFSKVAPEMELGPIKVATSWADLWSDGGDPDPVIKGSITPGKVEIPYLYQYQKYTADVVVKASDISDDISITGFTSVTPSVTVIPADEACSADGFTLTLTVDAATGSGFSEKLTLTSGETTATIPVNVNVVPVNTLMNFRFVPTMRDYETYYFSANAVVTFVDAANNKIYLQDAVGGMALGYEMTGFETPPFNAGDKVTGLYILSTESTFGVPGCELMAYNTETGLSCGNVTETGKVKEPIELTLADLNADPESYLSMLVRINDVTFDSPGSTFSAAGTGITSSGTAGKARAFANTDIFGTEIPENATSVTGISTSPSTVMLTLRSLADLQTGPAGEESLSVTEEVLVEPTEYYPLNQTTRFAKITVTAENLSAPAPVYITGTGRDQFKASLDEIPAGTGVHEILIDFVPTKTGRQQANILIDTTNPELSYSKSFACLAYDPDNLPEFSVEQADLHPFSAAVGSTEEQVLTITAKGLLDFGAVRVLGEGQGAFRINSTLFLKDGDTQLRVTFAPKQEGTFNETIEFTAAKAATVTVKVTGTAGAADPSDKEGDELVFDTSAPLTCYSTDFSNCGQTNKPLEAEGWKNVAINGNRAWWSYTDEDDNQVAKVTSYIWGGPEESELNAEMLLLSPALDYKNCTNRLLSFRVKGHLLSDEQTGHLSVLYIDPELSEENRYQVLIDYSQMPFGAEGNDLWQEIVLDLEDLDVADTFFIGFHYLSSAGANSPESYYVDDFSWGDPTQPFIRVDRIQAVTEAEVGQSAPLEPFTVTGINLTEPIAVSLEGKYKDVFKGPASLPAEGGQLEFSFEPQETGEQAVYVYLTSEGAPVTCLTIGGIGKEPSGIYIPGIGNDAHVAVYDLSGNILITDSNLSEALESLRKFERGIYILNVTAADGSKKTVKYFLK